MMCFILAVRAHCLNPRVSCITVNCVFMSDDDDDDDAVARLEVDSTLPGGTWESGGANVRSGYVAVECCLTDGSASAPRRNSTRRV